MNIFSTKKLANQVEMPKLGLGVWRAADGMEATNAVDWAIKANYRSIDTAAIYKNEKGVGLGIKQSTVARDELFITTKVWNSEQGYESTLQAFEDSLSRLSLEYIDLYLIHWPVAGKYQETWHALENLYHEKKVRAIGVCNFHIHHLENLLKEAEIKPMVNQIELHPLLNQQNIREYCGKEAIAVEAYSPLGQGELLENSQLKELAVKYGKTPAQIILRWDLQHDIITIPKSVHQGRIKENTELYDFQLSSTDMARIDNLNAGKRFGSDPDHFNFKKKDSFTILIESRITKLNKKNEVRS